MPTKKFNLDFLKSELTYFSDELINPLINPLILNGLQKAAKYFEDNLINRSNLYFKEDEFLSLITNAYKLLSEDLFQFVQKSPLFDKEYKSSFNGLYRNKGIMIHKIDENTGVSINADFFDILERFINNKEYKKASTYFRVILKISIANPDFNSEQFYQFLLNRFCSGIHAQKNKESIDRLIKSSLNNLSISEFTQKFLNKLLPRHRVSSDFFFENLLEKYLDKQELELVRNIYEIFPSPKLVKELMQEFAKNTVKDLANFEQTLIKTDSIIFKLVADIHMKLVKIHPFSDFNGRFSRMVMNAILIRYNHLPISFKHNIEYDTKYTKIVQNSNDKNDNNILAKFLFEEIENKENNLITKLCQNIYKNKYNEVKSIISQGININKLAKNRNTALHYACSGNNLDMIKLLLENGADTTIKTSKGSLARDLIKSDNVKLEFDKLVTAKSLEKLEKTSYFVQKIMQNPLGTGLNLY